MRFVISLLSVSLGLCLAGCSVQNTLHGASQAPGVVRLDDRTWVSDAPRFRLPASAGVVLVDDGTAPTSWVNAANTGLSQVFATSGTANYRVQIAWPQIEYPGQTQVHSSFKAGLFGIVEMPEVPRRQALNVKLLDASNQQVASMNMHISPQLWGQTWESPTMLSASFNHLAEVLLGR